MQPSKMWRNNQVSLPFWVFHDNTDVLNCISNKAQVCTSTYLNKAQGVRTETVVKRMSLWCVRMLNIKTKVQWLSVQCYCKVGGANKRRTLSVEVWDVDLVGDDVGWRRRERGVEWKDTGGIMCDSMSGFPSSRIGNFLNNFRESLKFEEHTIRKRDHERKLGGTAKVCTKLAAVMTPTAIEKRLSFRFVGKVYCKLGFTHAHTTHNTLVLAFEWA